MLRGLGCCCGAGDLACTASQLSTVELSSQRLARVRWQIPLTSCPLWSFSDRSAAAARPHEGGVLGKRNHRKWQPQPNAETAAAPWRHRQHAAASCAQVGTPHVTLILLLNSVGAPLALQSGSLSLSAAGPGCP
jgi:hypothetical protein